MAGIGRAGGAVLGDIWSASGHWVALVLLSIATSLDALAVGVSLPALNAPAIVALTMIGGITLLFSAAGAALGRFIGQRFGRLVEIAGGIGLVAIGIGIVFEHVT
jgi:putative Mn2+ efflux pump MntP